MSGDLSMGALMQISAWGLGLGTCFFSLFGIRVARDFFLAMGLVACVLGDLAFAAFLTENEGDGRSNATMVTLFCCFAALAFYALLCQLYKYKEEGCMDDEEDDEEEAPAPEPAAAPAPAPAAIEGGARRR